MDKQWIYGTEALDVSASVPYIYCSHKLTLCRACKLTDQDFYFISVELDMIKSVMALGRKMEISGEQCVIE